MGAGEGSKGVGGKESGKAKGTGRSKAFKRAREVEEEDEKPLRPSSSRGVRVCM